MPRTRQFDIRMEVDKVLGTSRCCAIGAVLWTANKPGSHNTVKPNKIITETLSDTRYKIFSKYDETGMPQVLADAISSAKPRTVHELRILFTPRRFAKETRVTVHPLFFYSKEVQMDLTFITPATPFTHAKKRQHNRCPLPSPRRRPHPVLRVQAAITPDFGRRQLTRDGKRDLDDIISSEQDWRKQNQNLVSTAQNSGVDAAIEMLWSLSREGTAVTQNFNQVVSLLASKGRFEDGLELAEEAGRRGLANIITFRPLMKRCCALGDGRGAKRVWKAMTRCEIDGDMFLYAELMGALVRAHDMQAAQRVINTLYQSGRRPHIVLYNTLLKGYAKEANVKSGFETLRVIEEAGIKPDETTFNTLLNICVRAKDPVSLNRAMSLMHKHKVKPGAPTFNTLLKLYSRVGKFEDALAIFEEMQQSVEPSIVTFNTLIDGCAHRGDMGQAAKFFDEMLNRGISPDICTMTSLLKGFGRSNDPRRAVELYEAMKQGGFKLEERTRYAVINACLRGNDRENARKLMSEMMENGIRIRSRTWMWLLESDVWEDDEEAAMDTVRNMYLAGASLDSPTKNALLKELRERGGMLRLLRELKTLQVADVRE